jgi:hypothetical protein
MAFQWVEIVQESRADEFQNLCLQAAQPNVKEQRKNKQAHQTRGCVTGAIG